MNTKQWILAGNVGVSSKTLWVAMMDIDMGEDTYGDVPHDPDDFSRCFDLMSMATMEERALALKNVVKINTLWTTFAREWKALETLYIEERGSGNCPKLYDLLQKLRFEAYDIIRSMDEENESGVET